MSANAAVLAPRGRLEHRLRVGPPADGLGLVPYLMAAHPHARATLDTCALAASTGDRAILLAGLQGHADAAVVGSTLVAQMAPGRDVVSFVKALLAACQHPLGD